MLNFNASYSQVRLNIETPEATLATKSVKNYSNILMLTYAQKISRNMFLGINTYMEESTENAVTYGVPVKRRFSSAGMREPALFSTYRLQHQNENQGVIDLYLSYSPTFGNREVGIKEANRLNGKSVTNLAISHGLWEEEWEFKSTLGFTYYGDGHEKNEFSELTYDLDSYFQPFFNFTAQYRIDPWLFVFGGVSAIYTGTQKISEPGGDKREISGGTGSKFQLGLKKPLSAWQLIEISYGIDRYEYFVKSTGSNLEGDAIQHNFNLVYKSAF